MICESGTTCLVDLLAGGEVTCKIGATCTVASWQGSASSGAKVTCESFSTCSGTLLPNRAAMVSCKRGVSGTGSASSETNSLIMICLPGSKCQGEAGAGDAVCHVQGELESRTLALEGS